MSVLDPQILDACCGGRMWWWDKQHPLAVYMDVRRAPAGSVDHRPNWSCEPDVVGDFRQMPFDDHSFRLVLFDPPHNIRERVEGRVGITYGALHPDTESDDLHRGFSECWRVLAPGGTLVFKWAGDISRVRPHFPCTPIVGTRSPRGGQTRWMIFYKQDSSVLAAQHQTLRDGIREIAESPEGPRPAFRVKWALLQLLKSTNTGGTHDR